MPFYSVNPLSNTCMGFAEFQHAELVEPHPSSDGFSSKQITVWAQAQSLNPPQPCMPSHAHDVVIQEHTSRPASNQVPDAHELVA